MHCELPMSASSSPGSLIYQCVKIGKKNEAIFYVEYSYMYVCVCLFVQAKAIVLWSEPFSVENGLLTPTFKLKRVALKNQFMESFVKLYSQLPS